MVYLNGLGIHTYISKCQNYSICVSVCLYVVNFSAAYVFNTLRPRRNEQHFADDIFKRIFFNENVWISIKISMKFVPKGPVNNIPSLVQIMAWRRSGDKPWSEPMMVSLPTHICVTRPQWVKVYWIFNETIDKMLYFKHVLLLKIYDAPLPSSDTK